MVDVCAPAGSSAGAILDDYDTPEQLARQLGVSTITLARWRSLRTGPPPTKFGQKIFYKKASAKAWLASQEARS